MDAKKKYEYHMRVRWTETTSGQVGRRGIVDGNGRDGARPSNSEIKTPPVIRRACQEAGCGGRIRGRLE
jgi:hypothetical protein